LNPSAAYTAASLGQRSVSIATPDTLRYTRIPLTHGSGAIPAVEFGTLIPDPLATNKLLRPHWKWDFDTSIVRNARSEAKPAARLHVEPNESPGEIVREPLEEKSASLRQRCGNSPPDLAMANAAFILSEMSFDSYSATAARIWMVKRLACGKSATTKSNLLSMRRAIKAALRFSKPRCPRRLA
jgi:hypothetical protein